MARPDPHPAPEAPRAEDATAESHPRGPVIQVATRCGTLEDFVEKFATFAAEGALVLPASGELPAGTEGRFVVLLRDKAIAMRGRCRVTEAKPAPGAAAAGVRRTMLRVALLEMDDATRAVHQRLLAAQRPPVPLPVGPTQTEPTEISPPRDTIPLRIEDVVSAESATAAPSRPPAAARARPTATGHTSSAPVTAARMAVQPTPAVPKSTPPSAAKAVTPAPNATSPSTPAASSPTPAAATARASASKGTLIMTARASSSPRAAPLAPPFGAKDVPPGPPEITRVVLEPESEWSRVTSMPVPPSPAEAPPAAPSPAVVARAPAAPAPQPVAVARQPVAAPPVAPSARPNGAGHARSATIVGVPAPPPASEEAPRAEARAPGAAFKLPANPFSELGPQDLASFVDCTLFESDGTAALGEALDAAAVPEVASAPAGSAPSGAPVVAAPPAAPAARRESHPALGESAAIPPSVLLMALPKGWRRAALGIVLGGCVTLGLAVGLAIRARSPAPVVVVPSAVVAAAPNPTATVATAPSGSAAPAPAPSPSAGDAPSTGSAGSASAAAVPAAPVPASAPAASRPAPTLPTVAAKTAAPSPAPERAEEASPAPSPVEAEAAAPAPARPARSGAAPATGCVASISTDPPGARVTWGDAVLGDSPLENAPVPCGTAVVWFRRDRYEPAKQEVTVRERKPASIAQRLRRPSATLVVGSSPPHGVITVNGQRQGAAPQRVTVSRYQTAQIEVSLPGYAPWKKDVYVRESEMRIGMVLHPAPAGKSAAR